MTVPGLTRNQLFLDDYWIEDTQRIARMWHSAEVHPEPLVRADRPWEGRDIRLVFHMRDSHLFSFRSSGR